MATHYLFGDPGRQRPQAAQRATAFRQEEASGRARPGAPAHRPERPRGHRRRRLMLAQGKHAPRPRLWRGARPTQRRGSGLIWRRDAHAGASGSRGGLHDHLGETKVDFHVLTRSKMEFVYPVHCSMNSAREHLGGPPGRMSRRRGALRRRLRRQVDWPQRGLGAVRLGAHRGGAPHPRNRARIWNRHALRCEALLLEVCGGCTVEGS